MIKQCLKSTKSIVYTVALVMMLAACGPTTAPTTGVAVQPPEATPTSEPTFTPLPAPPASPSPAPTPTPEPSPTAKPQVILSGRILNQDTGQPIADAQVSAGTAGAITDADGRYTLTDLPSGQYVLSVTHPDYDPGLSSIVTVAAGEELLVDVPLYAPDASPYPEDPMLTNPLDPNGAPTEEDAERLAREQGLTGEVVSIRETKLSGELLVNYKIGDDIRAAVALVRHEAWELVDEAGRKWWIIKVCGNLASRLPEQSPIATPAPKPLPPLAEVLVDGLVVRECASEGCGEVGTVRRGEQVEVFGCLAHETGGWCEVGWSSIRGWCTGQSLRQLAVAEAVPVVEAVLPTATPGVVAGEGKIVFGCCSSGIGNGIYVINPDGRDLTRLTDAPPEFDSSPAWSPDRQRVVFYRGADIYTVNVDGSNLTRLTNTTTFDDHPAWSPDGQRIAFESSSQGGTSISIINADGSGLTPLTDSGGSPSWSPDGTRVVFAGRGGIHVMNSNGSNLIRLTESGHSPDWSPDGTRIAFVLDGIYVMNADGSNQTRITDSGFFSPAWSPDGQQIVVSSWSARDGAETLYIMNADGSGLTRLIEGFEPDW